MRKRAVGTVPRLKIASGGPVADALRMFENRWIVGYSFRLGGPFVVLDDESSQQVRRLVVGVLAGATGALVVRTLQRLLREQR